MTKARTKDTAVPRDETTQQVTTRHLPTRPAAEHKPPSAEAETCETDATEKTTFMLTPANKRYLALGKLDGKGSMTKQVNRLIERARAAGS